MESTSRQMKVVGERYCGLRSEDRAAKYRWRLRGAKRFTTSPITVVEAPSEPALPTSAWPEFNPIR